MAQFDVYRNPRKGRFPFLLDVQVELLHSLETRVVVPLGLYRTDVAVPLSRLNPMLEIDGATYVAVFQELVAVPRAALGAFVSSAADRRTDLIAAIDFLFTGI